MNNIFHNERDYYKWSKQREFIAHMEGIDHDTRNKAINALMFLEHELGVHFLKIYSINHPIRFMISNKTGYQIKQLIEFVETMQILKATDSNYKKLIKKFLSEKMSKTEGMPFVEIARIYLKENLKISFIDEDAKNGNKTPDIEVINPENEDVFYIEITKLNYSDMQNLIRENYNFFHNEFNYIHPLFSFYGKQKQIIVKEKYPEIKEIINQIKNKVKDNNQIVYYSDNNFYCLLAPPSQDNNFNEICEKNNIEAIHFDGLPLNFEGNNRISNKISKAKQIPKNKNGLLYISVSPLYFMTNDLYIAIERLEANIAKHKNLLGIVLFTKIVDSREEVNIKIENHCFTRRTIENLCYESLFVYNNNCEVKLSSNTIAKIYNTLK